MHIQPWWRICGDGRANACNNVKTVPIHRAGGEDEREQLIDLIFGSRQESEIL
jgi:hypothetical protein